MENISFCNYIKFMDLATQESPRLWRTVEWYCPVAGRAINVTQVDLPNKLALLNKDQLADSSDHWLVTLLRVVSYFSVVLPLLAFGVRGYYRAQHSFHSLSQDQREALFSMTAEDRGREGVISTIKWLIDEETGSWEEKSINKMVVKKIMERPAADRAQLVLDCYNPAYNYTDKIGVVWALSLIPSKQRGEVKNKIAALFIGGVFIDQNDKQERVNDVLRQLELVHYEKRTEFVKDAYVLFEMIRDPIVLTRARNNDRSLPPKVSQVLSSELGSSLGHPLAMTSGKAAWLQPLTDLYT